MYIEGRLAEVSYIDVDGCKSTQPPLILICTIAWEMKERQIWMIPVAKTAVATTFPLRGEFYRSFVGLEVCGWGGTAALISRAKASRPSENFGAITAVCFLKCSIRQSTIHPPFRSRRSTAAITARTLAKLGSFSTAISDVRMRAYVVSLGIARRSRAESAACKLPAGGIIDAISRGLRPRPALSASARARDPRITR